MSYPASGGMVPGYLAVPAGAGPSPGVVVIHEIFSITTTSGARPMKWPATARHLSKW